MRGYRAFYLIENTVSVHMGNLHARQKIPAWQQERRLRNSHLIYYSQIRVGSEMSKIEVSHIYDHNQNHFLSLLAFNLQRQRFDSCIQCHVMAMLFASSTLMVRARVTLNCFH